MATKIGRTVPEPRKPPRQERSRQLVGAVIEAAIEILGRQTSPSGFSMRKLAERAGVGIGSIYDYFADRDALLNAVVDRLTDDNFKRLEASFPAELPLREALVRLFDATFDLYWGNETLTLVATEAITRFGQGKQIVAVRDRFLRFVTARIASELRGIDQEEVRVRVETMTDMAFGILISNLYRPLDGAAKAERKARAREIAQRAFLHELEQLRASCDRQPERAPTDAAQVLARTD